MLTQCPNCQTIFRITREILRMADGQVRCGRCQRQFDALERLIEEEADRATNPPQPELDRMQIDEEVEIEESPPHEDITLEGRRIEISGTYRVPDRFGDGERIEEQTIEEWVEIDEDADAPSDAEAEATPVENAADTESAEADRDALAQDDAVDAAQPVTADPPRFARTASHTTVDEEPAEDVDLLTPPPRKRSSWVWRVLVVPLALLLIAQWVHNYRATLARHPTIGAPLLSLYHRLGIALTPNWDLHAYQIRQWGVVSDPNTPGTLRVRASITNLADFAQPYPLLKLVLEDRWGEQVRAREFEPAEYLDPAIAPDRMLNPGQQANATIAIVDPGPDAEGFRFDVCLRGSAGTVCAEEVRRR